MLPHQLYSGVLDYEGYRHWLRFPLDYNASLSNITSAESYFSSIETTMQEEQALIQPPPIQPKHLQPIYVDDRIIVLNKPPGILSVPGPRRHGCAASLAYRYFGKGHYDIGTYNNCVDENHNIMHPLNEEDDKQLDTMIVHRLDRDTSGVLLLARNDDALKRLHTDFKNKARVKKTYVALVCGHWTGQSSGSCVALDEGEIDLPLVRDIERPPFMRVATVETEEMQRTLLEQKNSNNSNTEETINSGFLRMVGKGAKPSLTTYRILSYEYLIDQTIDNDGNSSMRKLPVTRLELHPITGRTHQLRVHCAALGHPIVGDSIYGVRGEGAPNGGLSCSSSNKTTSNNVSVQQDIYNFWLKRRTEQIDDAESKEECMLCLHAQQLNVFHPYTNVPMSFSSPPPF